MANIAHEPVQQAMNRKKRPNVYSALASDQKSGWWRHTNLDLLRLLWAELDSSGQNMNNPRTTPEQPHNNNPEKRSNGETLSGMSNPLKHQPMADEPPMFRGSEDQEERGTHVPVEFASANIDGAATTAPPVHLVFKYWQQRLDHPRAKLDRKRQRAIAARLKDGYSVDDLKRAIDGCHASPWHQGQNDKRRTFDDQRRMRPGRSISSVSRRHCESI